MSVKKLLLLIAAGATSIAMTSALAGGPDVAPPPAPMASDTGVYLTGNVGYARVNWRGVFGPKFSRRGKGGFAYGFDLGYQWNQYLAAELGWFYLPKVRVSAGGQIKSWFAYLAAKLMAPVGDNFNVFLKGGVAYRRIRLPSGRANVWRPLFGGGFMYTFNQSWMFNVQYLYVGAGSRALVSGAFFQTPAAHVFTAGLGYMFAV